jgi:hypothetical protein
MTVAAGKSMSSTDLFSEVHSIALRGSVRELRSESSVLLEGGLVHLTPAGYELTELGRRRHRTLLDHERRSLDLAALELAFAPLPCLRHRIRVLVHDWEAAGAAGRRRLIARLFALLDEADSIISRSAAVAPRFAAYCIRLRAAKEVLSGRDPQLVGLQHLGGIRAIWRELNEDVLQTLGCGHDLEDV